LALDSENKEKTQVLFVGTRRERETDDRRIYYAFSATAWGKVGEEDLPRFFYRFFVERLFSMVAVPHIRYSSNPLVEQTF